MKVIGILFHRFLHFFPNRNTFSMAVAASIVFHLLLFTLFILPVPFLGNQKASASSEENFLKALREINEEFPDRFKDLFPDATAPNITLDQHLADIKIQGAELSDAEEAAILKEVLLKFLENPELFKDSGESLEITAADIQKFLQSSDIEASGYDVFTAPSASGEEGFNLSVLGKQKGRRLERQMSAPVTVKELYKKEGGMVIVDMDGFTKSVPAEYFYRESPFKDILADGPRNFFIVSGFPDLTNEDQPDEESGSKAYSLSDMKLKDVFTVFLIRDVSAIQVLEPSEKSMTTYEPKNKDLSDIPQAAVLDDLMRYSEEEQLRKFQKMYFTPDKLNDRETADFTLKFFRSNLNNVLIHVSELSTAFDYIEEVHFNKAVDSRLIDFIKSHGDTRVGLEFIMVLASHYRFERKALMLLSAAYEEARKTLPLRMYRSEVHNKKAKSFVIKEMYEQLVGELYRLGYTTIDDAAREYAREEEKLYRYLISLDGEKRNIGLFALGRFYWRFDMRSLAVGTWNKIPDTYSTPLLDEIRLIQSNKRKLDSTYSLIDNTLQFYDNRNTGNLLKRLVQYKRWSKRGQN